MIDNPDYSKSTIRLLVFQALKQWKDDSLFGLLFDEDCIVRSAAAREIQIRGEKDYFEKVLELRKDSKSYIREICAFTLGQFGTPSIPYKEETIPYLSIMIKDEDADVRAAAISALGHLCAEGMSKKVETLLASMAEDPVDDVRASVAGVLGSSSGSKMVIRALEKLKDDNCEEVRSWAELGFELLDKRSGSR